VQKRTQGVSLPFPAETETLDREFLNAVWEGLSATPKTLPCRYFYDARGSALFEDITRLPEYYLTRTEIALIDRHRHEIARHFPKGGVLIEFGSGSSRKTLPLLKAAPQLAGYVPLDISAAAVFPAADRIRDAMPGLRVAPALADFNAPFELPAWAKFRPLVGFFPGSTLGNFEHEAARAFLSTARRTLGPAATFVIGIDLQKPLDVLLPAYNDGGGVTAAFNLNILARINRELGGNFDLDSFTHDAVFNAEKGRVEMHLVSRCTQAVHIAGKVFTFAESETIHTENSHKYTVAGFTELVREAGWEISERWTGLQKLFGIFALR
jgi:dimethylhistidine N-methyltransferase